MKLKRVLVVYKQSSYDLYKKRKDHHFLKALRKGDSTVSRFLPSHVAHQKSMFQLKEVFKKHEIQAKFIYRTQRFDDRKYDLIITLGGDGTFLEASHNVKNTPMLGVNSSPHDSVGVFCGVSADHFEQMIKKIIAGKVKLTRVARLDARVNGQKLPYLVLNDILVTHANPAATSRYVLILNGVEEEQKSSGIWLSTPAGSSAAMGSAGGKFMSIVSKRFQYLIRELYNRPGRHFHLRGGVVSPETKLTVLSKMRVGRIYMDGPHRVFPFPIGSKLVVSAKAPPIRTYAFNEKRRLHFR